MDEPGRALIISCFRTPRKNSIITIDYSMFPLYPIASQAFFSKVWQASCQKWPELATPTKRWKFLKIVNWEWHVLKLSIFLGFLWGACWISKLQTCNIYFQRICDIRKIVARSRNQWFPRVEDSPDHCLGTRLIPIGALSPCGYHHLPWEPTATLILGGGKLSHIWGYIYIYTI